MPTIDQILASLRHFVTFLMGVATAFGVSKIEGVDLSTISISIEHIFNGIKEIAVGLGPLIGIVMAYLAARRVNPAIQAKSVGELAGIERVVVRMGSSRSDPQLVEVANDPSHPKVVGNR